MCGCQGASLQGSLRTMLILLHLGTLQARADKLYDQDGSSVQPDSGDDQQAGLPTDILHPVMACLDTRALAMAALTCRWWAISAAALLGIRRVQHAQVGGTTCLEHWQWCCTHTLSSGLPPASLVATAGNVCVLLSHRRLHVTMMTMAACYMCHRGVVLCRIHFYAGGVCCSGGQAGSWARSG